MISSSAEIKRRIFIGLFGCLKSGFWSNRSAVLVVFLDFFSSRFWFYIMFWFLLPGDRASAQPGVCGCLFSVQEEPADASRLLLHVSGCEFEPYEIWEEVSSECCCCSKEHPSAALPGKISLFSYANELLFRVGAAEVGGGCSS